jgi:hypothetical protein
MFEYIEKKKEKRMRTIMNKSNKIRFASRLRMFIGAELSKRAVSKTVGAVKCKKLSNIPAQFCINLGLDSKCKIYSFYFHTYNYDNNQEGRDVNIGFTVGGGPNAKIDNHIHKENDELYNKYLSECIGIAKDENIIFSIRQLFSN